MVLVVHQRQPHIHVAMKGANRERLERHTQVVQTRQELHMQLRLLQQVAREVHRSRGGSTGHDGTRRYNSMALLLDLVEQQCFAGCLIGEPKHARIKFGTFLDC